MESRSGKTEFNIRKRVDVGIGAARQLTRACSRSFFFGYFPKSISLDTQAVGHFAPILPKRHRAPDFGDK